MNSDFSEKLKKGLRDKGIDEHGQGIWLAERLGVTPKAVSKWLRSESIPRPSRWAEIAKAIDKPAKYFYPIFVGHDIDQDDSKPKYTDDEIFAETRFSFVKASDISEKYKVERDPNFFGVEVPAEKSVDHLFAKIPKYDVELSAGHGSSIAEEDGNGFLYFRKDWIERKELSEDKLCVVYVKGDSMEPTINSGEVILVDTSEYYTHVENVDDGFIYAVNIDGEAMVKRLFKKPGGRIIVRSDSPAPQYQDMVLEKEDMQYLRIIGRAIWHAGDL